MTADELRARTTAWRAARQQELVLRNDRDNAILQALREGMTEREVAKVVGVHHSLPGHLKRRA